MLYFILFNLFAPIFTLVLKERTFDFDQNILQRRHSSKSRSKSNSYSSKGGSYSSIPASLPPIVLDDESQLPAALNSLNPQNIYDSMSSGGVPSYGSSGSSPSYGSTGSSPSYGSTGSSPSYGSTEQTPPNGSNGNSPLDYNYMLQKVNQVRAQNGAPPLKYNNLLNTAAQQHSDDQARVKKMSHTGSDGSSPDERVEKAGYKWTSVAENVAWNQKTVDQVMDAWVKSPGHFKNLVNKKYTDFGAGVNNYYWTQTFGSTS